MNRKSTTLTHYTYTLANVTRPHVVQSDTHHSSALTTPAQQHRVSPPHTTTQPLGLYVENDQQNVLNYIPYLLLIHVVAATCYGTNYVIFQGAAKFLLSYLNVNLRRIQVM
jgi:hypothetical protein